MNTEKGRGVLGVDEMRRCVAGEERMKVQRVCGEDGRFLQEGRGEEEERRAYIEEEVTLDTETARWEAELERLVRQRARWRQGAYRASERAWQRAQKKMAAGGKDYAQMQKEETIALIKAGKLGGEGRRQA